MKQEFTTDEIAEQDNQPEPSRNNIRGSSRIKYRMCFQSTEWKKKCLLEFVFRIH